MIRSIKVWYTFQYSSWRYNKEVVLTTWLVTLHSIPLTSHLYRLTLFQTGNKRRLIGGYNFKLFQSICTGLILSFYISYRKINFPYKWCQNWRAWFQSNSCVHLDWSTLLTSKVLIMESVSSSPPQPIPSSTWERTTFILLGSIGMLVLVGMIYCFKLR